MAGPQENNNVTKRDGKRIKYRQLAFELRERRVEYKTYVALVFIGALGGSITGSIHEIKENIQAR